MIKFLGIMLGLTAIAGLWFLQTQVPLKEANNEPSILPWKYEENYIHVPALPVAGVDIPHAMPDTMVDVDLVEIGTGIATFYGDWARPGMLTLSGRGYHPEARIVAVPLEIYYELVGKEVKVTNMETGVSMWLEVADSGSGLGSENIIDLPDNTWRELSGKPHSAGVFQVRLERR